MILFKHERFDTMSVYTENKFDLIQRVQRFSHNKMGAAHIHNTHELYFLESGETIYTVENKIHVMHEGEMIFIPKGIFHKTSNETSNKSERVLIVFDDDFIGSEFLGYIDKLKENNIIILPEEYVFKARKLLKKIELEAKQKYQDYKLLQKLYLEELIIMISRHRIDSLGNKCDESIKIIQSITKYISENFSSEITLASISTDFALSQSYLSKQFKVTTGIGLNEYINITRVNAAVKLLTAERLPITEVAFRCGFNDSNYFASVFKKIKGITPKKFSMQCIKEDSD